MPKKALYTSGIVLFLLIFFSCRKERENPSWDTQVLTPLIHSSFDITNLLPDSILHENPDSSLEIVYQKALYNFDIGNLFTIPDTSLHAFYTIPLNFTLNPGQVIPFPSFSETVYNLPGVELKTFTVKKGKVTFKVKSYVREVTNFVYSIPCATKNGLPFSEKINVPARIGKKPGVFDKEFDLSGYVINLTGTNGSKVNAIYTTLKAAISPDALDTVLVTPYDSLIINNSFSDILPSYAKGYLGQNTIEIPNTQTNLSFFDRISGNVKLEDVKFELALHNYIGVDARATLQNLKAINTNTGKIVTLVANSPSVNINRASDNGNAIIPSHAYFPLTAGNSNIKELIENIPNRLEYQLKVNMNPLGNVSGSNDFIYTDKLLNGFLEMRVPLSFMANNLTLTSVLDFNISSGDNRNLNSGTLYLYADNGFPFDAAIQLYTLNEAGAVTDSLVSGSNTIIQAPVNAQLKVTGKRLTKLTIPVNRNQMQHLYNTQRVRFKAKFNTSSQPQYIKIYDNYTLDIKLVGDFNYTLQIQ